MTEEEQLAMELLEHYVDASQPKEVPMFIALPVFIAWVFCAIKANGILKRFIGGRYIVQPFLAKCMWSFLLGTIPLAPVVMILQALGIV